MPGEAMVPTPRRKMVVPDVWWEACRVGICVSIVIVLNAPVCAASAAESTATAIGTSCRRSLRRWAVTTTSWRAFTSADTACALATPPVVIEPTDKHTPSAKHEYFTVVLPNVRQFTALARRTSIYAAALLARLGPLCLTRRRLTTCA